MARRVKTRAPAAGYDGIKDGKGSCGGGEEEVNYSPGDARGVAPRGVPGVVLAVCHAHDAADAAERADAEHEAQADLLVGCHMDLGEDDQGY